ncbi:MAG: HEPN domain-containing protein [Oscillospiraceae bacterium]|nr:HEPN domain-containing protein [Oscillospiraceae bacterium]
MSNFGKYEYWLELCDDDLDVAKCLLQGRKLLYCGYFCHLIIEKAFKARIARNTREIPPKIHDLHKLAEEGGMYEKLSRDQLKLLDKLKNLNIEARYPEYKDKIYQSLSLEYCEKLIEETEGLLCWIKKQSEK